ncbi:hypothetical protein EMCRGX_G033649 [Ephydatia muelleri]
MNAQTPVNLMLNTIDKENIARNRNILESIVDTIILCGQQCLPLCGHHDDSTAFDDVDHNPGNCMELLKFRGRCGDDE